MPRRVSLPGADELFRATGGPVGQPPPAAATLPQVKPGGTDPDSPPPQTAGSDRGPNGDAPRAVRATGPRQPTGRERHDDKITVYVSPSELVDLEHARLMLRAEHGLGVDRGRIVREALAVVLADLEAKGESSILVRRLRQP